MRYAGVVTQAPASSSSRHWTFLTNHGHAIIYLKSHPDARIRDIAEVVGITERAAQAILSDLEAGGYVTKTKIGRRNHYELHDSLKFRHPVEAGHKVSELLEIFSAPAAQLAQ